MKPGFENLLVIVAAAFAAHAAGAATPGAGIRTTAHDFSGSGWTNVKGEVCIICHAPHNNVNTAGTVLWNHALTTATYALYSSPTMGVTTGEPGAVSKLCLSCHDGTVAMDSFGGANGSFLLPGGYQVGTDLSNDHPIGISYNVTLGGGLRNPMQTLANVGPGGKYAGTIMQNLLVNSKVECTSCHDVHNIKVASTAGYLRISNDASALCLTCHIK